MRFNPKARLDTSRVGDGGGGRRGGGGGRGGGAMRLPLPGGTKAGGGIGTILVIVLIVVLSQCMGEGGTGLPSGGGQATGGTDTARMVDSDRYANCKTGADAETDVDCARIAVENSLFNYWSQEAPKLGADFVPARMMTFSGAVNTGCGEATSQVGPFYCPPDETIYLDTTFFQDVLEGQLGGQGGEFVEPYVIGHEYGHHLQNLLGIMGRVRPNRAPSPTLCAWSSRPTASPECGRRRPRAPPTGAAWRSSRRSTSRTSPRPSTPRRPSATTASSSDRAAGSTPRGGRTARPRNG